MRKEYTVEERVNNRVWFYTFTDTNAKGEKICFELSKCENSGGSHALPVLWAKSGYIDRVLDTYWCLEVYATDTERQCWGRYNPCTKLSEDGKRAVINFDWMFESTEENREKLIEEVYRLASSATGETATEVKRRKVREHGKKYNIDIVETMPEGFFESSCATDPRGAVSIINKKWSLEALHDETYQRKLLLV